MQQLEAVAVFVLKVGKGIWLLLEPLFCQLGMLQKGLNGQIQGLLIRGRSGFLPTFSSGFGRGMGTVFEDGKANFPPVIEVPDDLPDGVRGEGNAVCSHGKGEILEGFGRYHMRMDALNGTAQ